MKRRLTQGLILGLVCGGLLSCRPAAPPVAAPSASPAPAAGKAYPAVGVIRAFQPDGKIVVIKHEAIAGLMDAMTMAYELKDPAQARGLKVGDAVRFTLWVQGDGYSVSDLERR